MKLATGQLVVNRYIPYYSRDVLRIARKCDLGSAALAALERDLVPGKYLAHVALIGSWVAGYAVSTGGGRRRWILDRIAVDPSVRRQMVGAALLDKLEDHCRWSGRSLLAATVPGTDAAAVAFFAACGFHATHVALDVLAVGQRGSEEVVRGEEAGYRFVREILLPEHHDAMCRGR